MVELVREGWSLRQVARKCHVALCTVQRWVARAGDEALEEVEWSDRASGCRVSSRRTKSRVEKRVLKIRRQLKTNSDLGEYGAKAIQRELERLGDKDVPSVRTIGRILDRGGALDGRRRQRFKAPPPGWYLPKLFAKAVEMDSFDAIEDLVIRGGHDVNVLTGISLHGGLCAAWPAERITAKLTVECLLEHWRNFGLPAYAKFDNDTVFQGAHQWPDSFGRVTRLCLSLGVIPVFAPPLSRGFQADIEAFNGRWQKAVWSRFKFRCLQDVAEQSQRYIAAHRERYAVRIEEAPSRRPFPSGWRLDLQRPLQGTVIYIRVTDHQGKVYVLGHTWEVSELWCHGLVRIEVDLTKHHIRFYSLRRKEPSKHVLLSSHKYQPRKKRFSE